METGTGERGTAYHITDQRKRAMTFVALIGVVSLFADMTYEAARSINGPYLAVLGLGSLAVGIIAGVGELLGYLIRPLSGNSADRTGRYWTRIVPVAGLAGVRSVRFTFWGGLPGPVRAHQPGARRRVAPRA
jgi:hypothetical protein